MKKKGTENANLCSFPFTIVMQMLQQQKKKLLTNLNIWFG